MGVSKFFLILLALASASAIAADDVTSLCEQGIEGSYAVAFGAGTARVNLICVDKDRLSATFAQMLDDQLPGASMDSAGAFTHASIDGDQLVMSDFPPNNEDRRGHSSKGMSGYMRLSI